MNRAVRLLLVEDNEGDALLLTTLLRDLSKGVISVECQVVHDGEAATDYLFRRGSYAEATVPDIVLLDVNLPKKNGFEVLTEMRTEPRLAAIPVFFLSSSKSHEDIMHGRTLEAISFITKPRHLAELEQVMKQFLTVDIPRVLGKS